MADLVCPDCIEVIGYDTRFFRDPDFDGQPCASDHLVHARCLYGRQADQALSTIDSEVKKRTEADVLEGAAEDLRLAVGRLRRASRRVHQLAEASGLPLYEGHAAQTAGELERLERLEASIRGRLAVVRAGQADGQQAAG